MAETDVTNLQIKIFRNASDNPKAPALKGVLVRDNGDGTYTDVAELAAWYVTDRETGEKRMDKKGNPFLSGKTKPVYVRPENNG